MIFGSIALFQIALWSWGVLGHLLFNIMLAWLVGISLEPVVGWPSNRGMRRGLATAIVATVVLALLAAFIALLGGALARQIAELITALPRLIVPSVDWVNSSAEARPIKCNAQGRPRFGSPDARLRPWFAGVVHEASSRSPGGAIGYRYPPRRPANRRSHPRSVELPFAWVIVASTSMWR